MDVEQSVSIISLLKDVMVLIDSRFRKAGYQAIDRICDYYYSLQDKPVVSSVKPGYLREALPCAYLPPYEILAGGINGPSP
jgi:hypothetical protein